MTSVRRAALIAAIAVALVDVSEVCRAITVLSKVSDPVRSCIFVATGILLKLPLPVLLFILYRSDATLSLSKVLRRLALVTALTFAALFAAPHAYGWIRSLPSDRPDVTWSDGGTAIRQVLNWLISLNVGRLLWGAAGWLAETALVLFLIALFRHQDEASEPEPRQSRLLREMAALTTLAAGLTVIVLIGMEPVAVIGVHNELGGAWFGPQMRRLILGHVWYLIQAGCWLVTPFIVYRMQPPASAEPAAAPVSSS